jgi:hypothetical protein
VGGDRASAIREGHAQNRCIPSRWQFSLRWMPRQTSRRSIDGLTCVEIRCEGLLSTQPCHTRLRRPMAGFDPHRTLG